LWRSWKTYSFEKFLLIGLLSKVPGSIDEVVDRGPRPQLVSRGVGAEEVGEGVVGVPKTDGTLVSSENSVNSLTDISMANLGRSGRLGLK
jgi:hypothetical protein